MNETQLKKVLQSLQCSIEYHRELIKDEVNGYNRQDFKEFEYGYIKAIQDAISTINYHLQ